MAPGFIYKTEKLGEKSFAFLLVFLLSYSKTFKKRIYLFIRARERARVGVEEGQRERVSSRLAYPTAPPRHP